MEQFNTVFVNMDFGKCKAKIEQALDADDIQTARELSAKVLMAQTEIRNGTKMIGGKLVFESGTNFILNVPYDEELIEGFSDAFKDIMGVQANMGIGKTPAEAHESLHDIDDNTDGNIVLSSLSIREDLVSNRKFYKQATKDNYDLGVAGIIKSALLEMKVITSEQKVYDIFMRLGEKNGLDTLDKIQSFYFKPLEEVKASIRDVYKKQTVSGLLFANKPQSFPGQSVVNRNKHQKSPHKRLNWWSIEEYNQDTVDYRKTDLQHINNNVTQDSQEMSMGGEPGNSIYIP